MIIVAGSEGRKIRTDDYWKAASEWNEELLEHHAAYLDNGEGLEAVFENTKNEKGETAVHVAAKSGHQRILLKYFFEGFNLSKNLKDNKGRTPLHNAVRKGDLQTTKYLLSVYLTSTDHSTETYKGYIEVTTNNGYTPLHYAAERGDVQIMETLIDSGANVDAVSDYGTPLRRAIAYKRGDAVKSLLDHKANPNLDSPDSLTPIMSLVFANSSDCLELLLKAGADPNIRSRGATPLRQATIDGATGTIGCLLEFGADPNVADESGIKPLEWAALYRHHEALNILFPVTTLIEDYPDWSINGIMKHIHSQARMTLAEMIITFQSSAWFGLEAFEEKDYHTAISWFTQALNVANERLLSDRSKLCAAKWDWGRLTSYDSKACITPKLELSKPRYMKAAAFKILKFGETPLEHAAFNGHDGSVNFLYQKIDPIHDYSDAQKDLIQMLKTFLSEAWHANKAIERKNYHEAMSWYNEALASANSRMLAYRSMCWVRLKDGFCALHDSNSCISMRPDWWKGHSMKGTACKMLKNHDEAEKSFSDARAGYYTENQRREPGEKLNGMHYEFS